MIFSPSPSTYVLLDWVCSAVIHVLHDSLGFTTSTTPSPGATRANIRDATRPLPIARARAHPPPIDVGT